MTIVTKETIDGYEIAIQPSDKKFVLVPVEAYKELVDKSKILNALYAGGVDNWEWYEDSMQKIWDEE